uniref:Oligosaccharide repeat unit polymerase n=1 Tax=candidate division CPR3 bacterium TaxID=2268181 RepID=A0A7C5URZ0_UNCC3
MDSIGLVIAPYLPLEKIKYLTNPVFLINDGDLNLYLKQVSAHWIFLIISLLGILFEMSRTKKPKVPNIYRKSTVRMFGVLLFLIGLVAYIKYFFIGPGLQILLSTRLFFSSTSESVASRVLARKMIQYSQGAYASSLASAIIFPVSALFFLRSLNKGKWLSFLLCAFLSFMYAYQTRQKGPLLFWFLTYFLLFALERQNIPLTEYKNILKSKFMKLSVFVGLVGAIVLYVINFGQSLTSAIEAALARIFIIPGAVENYYFAVFPQIYNYRGIFRIFNMPLGFLPVNNDISIYDVAQAITGTRSSTNASFIAVAWSGAGYSGVFLASVILVFLLIFVDIELNRLEYKDYLEILVLSLYSLIGLNSGSIMDYISKGGIIIPLVVTFVFTLAKTKPRRLD